MKYFFMKIAVCGLRVLYVPIKIFPIQEKITFISRQSDEIGMDFQLLISYLRKDKSELEIKVLTKKIGEGIKAKLFYIINIFLQMYHIATSRVVVIDGYCISVSVLQHKQKTKIVQLWHALGAIKKFGYQTLDKPEGTKHEVAEIMCMHKNYDYVICASEATAPYFCEGFNVDKEKIVIMSLPRVDYIMTPNIKCEESIIRAYPQILKKETVLYVPTFRKNRKVELTALIDKIDFKKYNLVVKLHPLDMTNIDEEFVPELIIDNMFSAYEWMHVADKIITDYSSLGIEACMLNTPLYFYVYDIYDYENNPGLNISLKEESIGEYVFTDVGELTKAMEFEYDFGKLQSFRKKYIASNDRDNTKKLANFIEALVYE